MKKINLYLLLFFAFISRAQQTIIYNQVIFNKAGINPAASGTDIHQDYCYTFGRSKQWYDFDNAPRTTFVNFSRTIRQPRSYHYWQNIGFYVDSEQSGAMSNSGAYLNYTIHLLMRKNLTASFGMYVGARDYVIKTSLFDPADPAVQKSNANVFVYPDCIPGFRLSNKKFFFDLAVRQITITKLQGFRKHQIGSPPSKLNPTIFLSYGKKIPLSYNFLFLPSISLNTSIGGIPSVDLNLMFYYARIAGIGFAIRNTSFATAIFQIKIIKTVTIGVAYSYSVNKTRYAMPNSYEIMIGMTPMGMDSKSTAKHSVSKCPTLTY